MQTKSQLVLIGDIDPKASMPGCANFDYHYDSCLFRDGCLVQQGKRCDYFERAVLPAIDDNIMVELYN